MDTDFGSASPEKGAAYLGMLATDALLAVVAATERLADAAVDGAPPSPDRCGRPWWHASRPGGLDSLCSAKEIRHVFTKWTHGWEGF
jgi:hypothetical protein